MVNIEAIIWWLFLLDSLGAVLVVSCCSKKANKWFRKSFPRASKHLPLTKGWALVYLVLVLWVGYSLYRLGILSY